MRALTCVVHIRCCTIPYLAFLAMSFSLPTQAQGIFEDLPYNEQAIRNIISEHTLQFSSPDNPDAIPEHVFYQQVFIDLLVDPGAMAQLPADDVALIRALPAHQDVAFVERDQAELSSLCERLNGAGEQEAVMVGAAEAFDQSHLRRQYDLDIHYATVIRKLSEPTQRLILAQGVFRPCRRCSRLGKGLEISGRS